MHLQDPLMLYGKTFHSRLMMGTARHASYEALCECVKLSQTQIITLSLRREVAEGRTGQLFWEQVRHLGVAMLPNTAGCFTVKDAITTAQMAREVFNTPWIKLEVLTDQKTLSPDVFGLVDAAQELIRQGFEVFPYTTDDLRVAERLLDAGCRVLMPWAAPIGSGRGINNPYALSLYRQHFPTIPLIVDAGIGCPSHALAALEMGIDAVLLNTAIARAGQPELMAQAFATAVQAGRMAYLATPMAPQETAIPSTPMAGLAKLGA